MKKLYFAALVFLIASCSTRQEQKRQEYKIGKYLYMTDNSVLHTRKDCIGISFAKDENGHRVYGMQFLDTAFFCPNFEFSYCTRCFDDDCYVHVQKILQRNDEDRTPPSRRNKALILNPDTGVLRK